MEQLRVGLSSSWIRPSGGHSDGSTNSNVVLLYPVANLTLLFDEHSITMEFIVAVDGGKVAR